jgi:hypothetical protein
LYQRGETVDSEAISGILDELEFPLYFYDYETVASPMPIFEGTHPWQSVVVQYSLHVMRADGSTSHFAAIVEPGASDNRRVVESFVRDIGEADGTFVVWNKAFECTRNNETAELYPEFREIFEKVNSQTFDLMEIFRNLHYFHPDFHGSASIKKVLPVLTKMSYDGLEVGNGGEATELLKKLVVGGIADDEVGKVVGDLLEYCKQDSWAMVEIWGVVRGRVG